MELTQIISLVTFIVTLILGFVSKKSKFISNNLIPVQRIITKDFNTAIALSGIMAGGAYDIVHNIQKMKIENKEEN